MHSSIELILYIDDQWAMTASDSQDAVRVMYCPKPRTRFIMYVGEDHSQTESASFASTLQFESADSAPCLYKE